MLGTLNREQRSIYNIILDAVHFGQPHVAFIDGPAGRGKTFLVNALCAQLRAEGRIVLPTATSGYAAQLYPGGRTTHSTFKVTLLSYHMLLLLTAILTSRFLSTTTMSSSNPLSRPTPLAPIYSAKQTLPSGTRLPWLTKQSLHR